MPSSSAPDPFQSPTIGTNTEPRVGILFFFHGLIHESVLHPLLAVILRFNCHSCAVVLNTPMLEDRRSNVATHDVLPFAMTTPPAQLRSPLHPVKAEPRAGAARRTTRVAAAKFAEQSVTQSIDPGLPVTRPFPLPLRLTFSVLPLTANMAVQVLLRFMITTPSKQSGSPLHPEKTEPEAGVGVRATVAPFEKSAVQVDPQSIPTGLLVTLPVPVPAVVTLPTTLTISFGF